MQKSPTTVTYEDLEYLDRCERLYELNRAQPPSTPVPDEQRAAMASGRAHHRASATKDPVRRTQIIEQELTRVPVPQREEVRSEITEMVKNSDESAVTEDVGLEREVQLFWFDPKTEWTFASKPDLFGSHERISIKEEKRSGRYHESHRFQVFFAAFVAARIDADEQSQLPVGERKPKAIDITIRCSRFTEAGGIKRRLWERTFRYPVAKLERETWAMRDKIKLIKRRERSNYFIPKLELGACSSCPRRGECKALLRNPPLLEQVKAEEIRTGRATAFAIIDGTTPASSSAPVNAMPSSRNDVPTAIAAIAS